MTYNAGSDGSSGYGTGASPLSALGLVEFPNLLVDSVPLRIHDGTFVLTGAGGLWETPDARTTDTSAPYTHGAYPSSAFYLPRAITLEGFILADTLPEVWEAVEILRRINLHDGLGYQHVESIMPGWRERRFQFARPAGPLLIAEPGVGSQQRQPRREFLLPLVAPNPRQYGATLRGATTQVTANGLTGAQGTVQVLNEGNFPAPFEWVVVGPWNSPRLIDSSRGREIRYEGLVDTGQTLRVESSGRTATLNGANVYRNLSRFDDLEILPGGRTYEVAAVGSSAAGGTTRVEHRSVWV